MRSTFSICTGNDFQGRNCIGLAMKPYGHTCLEYFSRVSLQICISSNDYLEYLEIQES